MIPGGWTGRRHADFDNGKVAGKGEWGHSQGRAGEKFEVEILGKRRGDCGDSMDRASTQQ